MTAEEWLDRHLPTIFANPNWRNVIMPRRDPRFFGYTLTDEETIDKVEAVKQAFANLAEFVEENLGDCRERSITITELQQACRWTIAGMFREGADGD